MILDLKLTTCQAVHRGDSSATPQCSQHALPCPPSLLLCEAALDPFVVLQVMGCTGNFCTPKLILGSALPRM